MTNERKKLYIYTAINFLMGIIIGIILFYSQLKNKPEIFSLEYSYDSSVGIFDTLRAWWLNVLWLFSIVIAQGILPLGWLHITVWVRGCANAFSIMYILNFIGIKEAVASALPQCFSILPLMLWFSVVSIEKRKKLQAEGSGPLVICRKEALLIFAFSLFGAVLEVLLFAASGSILL